MPVDLPDAAAAVAAADPQLAAFIDRAGPYPPRPGDGDALASLARAIVFQQLATGAAAAIHGRFVAAIGGTVSAGAILATE
ncbi:MAG: DNA-3-methyladenine glycosylase 2 family protein, partial [Candidatus Limnocylindrales bacterium]